MADFDDLVGRLDYPMLIVTANDGHRRAGCLVGFASQCAIDPPRYMVWLSKNNRTFQVAGRCDRLGVHVLGRGNRLLAELFGTVTGFDEDKFTRCEWHDGPDGVPVLADCPQWFVGRVLSRHDTGDHEGILLEPTAVGGGADLGQLGFQSVRDLDAGNEA
ncbi:flavin reductase family protein [Actinophytocola oryzae]|uniref:Flavin reductase (DIM6/NTAB) family NADH-FMN oxidoreductase RutF n=1 Tax=Actinophytocola oryzae TaxID=502181 RepID=A0A4R7W3M2_9PSEU|nr:flavin reductase family protein [Actinophytocola oryzae]TDV56539.1 flavin reductase (DIM6/NTAB) family NADH-FMN oxidoreductase RutF [Actinophytocola oryzae]